MKWYLHCLFAISLLPGCRCQDEERQPAPPVRIPSFNADSAYNNIAAQVGFGPRAPNTPEHDSCAAWLAGEMGKFAEQVIEQKTSLPAYDGKMLNITNIIGTFNADADHRILLCAHWDTRPWADQDTAGQDLPIEGANDGGSGVGILLEIARILKSNPPSHGVDIIFFDAEDYGRQGYEDSYCLGSQHWSRNRHTPGYSAAFGILLDMAGAEGAAFYMEGTSRAFAPAQLRMVWDAANKLGYSSHFLYEKSPAVTDDHFYINSITGIPTIDIIEYDPDSHSGFNRHWHTHRDNLSIISRETLKAVGQTVLAVIYSGNIYAHQQ